MCSGLLSHALSLAVPSAASAGGCCSPRALRRFAVSLSLGGLRGRDGVSRFAMTCHTARTRLVSTSARTPMRWVCCSVPRLPR